MRDLALVVGVAISFQGRLARTVQEAPIRFELKEPPAFSNRSWRAHKPYPPCISSGTF